MECQDFKVERKAFYDPLQDRRKDIYQVNDPNIIEQARSIACLVEDRFLKLDDTQSSIIEEKVSSLIEDLEASFGKPLEESAKFRNQPCLGFGSAFLVGKKHILTAAHCVPKNNERIKSMKVIFDFQMNNLTESTKLFETYGIKSVKQRVYIQKNGKRTDFALLKLDREVKGRIPLELSFSKVKKGEKVYILGHPMGLPLKYTYGGRVQRTSHPTFFETDSDAFAGNSGSAVFNKKGKVVGILCSGNGDYQLSLSGESVVGYVVNPATEGYERCQKISALKKVLTIQNKDEPKRLVGVQRCVLQ